MRELPFKVGDEIKNYKEMCKLLDEKVRTSNSKNSQLSRWKNYFEWENKGYSFIITNIINTQYPTHDDNRASQMPRIREKTMLSTSNKHSNTFCLLIERHMWDENFATIYWVFIEHWEKVAPSFPYQASKGLFYTNYGYHSYLTKITSNSCAQYLRYYNLPKAERILLEQLRDKLLSKKTANKKPKKSLYYLYKFINKQGIVIYIGKTTNLSNRLNQHFSNGHLPERCYEEIARISYLPVETEMLMTIMEIYFIAKFFPKYNVSQKFDDYTPIAEWNRLPWITLDQTETIELPFLYSNRCNLHPRPTC